MLKVSVIGLGAWGSALGVTAHRAGSDVTMIGFDHEVDRVKEKGCIAAFPDTPFPRKIKIESTHDSLKTADLVVFVVPSQMLRTCLKGLKNLPETTPIMIASKGIEQSTGCLMGEVAQDVLKNPVAILSGPNFASEVMDGLPAATTIGCADQKIGKKIVQAFAHKNFRPYLNSDVVGVQIGGAIKNVLAVGCGIIRARGLGENAVASLITRGLDEMKTFGLSKGADISTFLGLSGVGDVVLTCMGTQSRNFLFGFDLATTNTINTKELEKTTVEGFYTTKALYDVAERLKINMPVCSMVYDILYEGVAVDDAISRLLERPLKEEGSF